MRLRAGRPPWQRWGLILGLWFGVWTLLALFDIAQIFFLFHATTAVKTNIPVDVIIGRGLADWYLWALLTPSLVWLAGHLPLGGPRWARNLGLQGAASAGLSLIKLGLDIPFVLLFRCQGEPGRSIGELFEILFFAKFLIYLIICGVVLGASHALAYYRKFREGEQQASLLAAELAQTQLQVLKMQLHPHFLFNTLHAISALMHKDVELADRMIARLGELLRSTLEHVGTQEVPLRDELEFIKPYLDIEQARLGPRLSVQLDIDPEAMDANVPNLILQPLVENAIRHGIAPRAGAGRIEIHARRENGRIRLQVCDNGRGLATNYVEGVGVGNTRARLRQLYGEEHQFVMCNRPDGGLEVTVSLPFSNALPDT
jgi:two-component system LytT family sensor kinase